MHPLEPCMQGPPCQRQAGDRQAWHAHLRDHGSCLQTDPTHQGPKQTTEKDSQAAAVSSPQGVALDLHRLVNDAQICIFIGQCEATFQTSAAHAIDFRRKSQQCLRLACLQVCSCSSLSQPIQGIESKNDPIHPRTKKHQARCRFE